MEFREPLHYTVPKPANGSAPADFSGGSAVSLNAAYSDVAAIKAIAGTAFIDLQGQEERHPIRVTLTMAINGVATKTAAEDVYLVIEEDIDGTKQLSLAKLGNAVYTAGSKAVGTARNSSHKRPNACSWTGTDLSKMMGGGEDCAVEYDDGVQLAGVCVFDVGNAVGILRVPYMGGGNAGTSCAPMHFAWR